MECFDEQERFTLRETYRSTVDATKLVIDLGKVTLATTLNKINDAVDDALDCWGTDD